MLLRGVAWTYCSLLIWPASKWFCMIWFHLRVGVYVNNCFSLCNNKGQSGCFAPSGCSGCSSSSSSHGLSPLPTCALCLRRRGARCHWLSDNGRNGTFPGARGNRTWLRWRDVYVTQFSAQSRSWECCSPGGEEEESTFSCTQARSAACSKNECLHCGKHTAAK